MEKPRLILCDVDDTLLTSDKRILEEVKHAVRSLKMSFVLASGRLLPSLRLLYEELGIYKEDSLYVGIGGSVVAENKKLLQDIRLDKEVSLEMLEDMNSFNGLKVFIYNPESWYCSTQGPWTDKETLVTRVKGVCPFPLERIIVEEGASKLLIESNSEQDLDRCLETLKQKYGSKVEFTKSSPLTVELNNKGVDKSSCFNILCQRLGIQDKDIMAIGDYYNDRSMLEKAGISVAMGNAPNQIKQICDYVTTDCDHGGLAQALERFAL